MAHECPECGHNCHCGGDIEDCDFGDVEAGLACVHCTDEDVDALGDKVFRFCVTCDEEYELPEDLEACPICGKDLTDDYMLPDDDLSHLF